MFRNYVKAIRFIQNYGVFFAEKNVYIIELFKTNNKFWRKKKLAFS